MNRNYFTETLEKDEKSYYNCHYVTIDNEVFVIHETVTKGEDASKLKENIDMWLYSCDADGFMANYTRTFGHNDKLQCVHFSNDEIL